MSGHLHISSNPDVERDFSPDVLNNLRTLIATIVRHITMSKHPSWLRTAVFLLALTITTVPTEVPLEGEQARDTTLRDQLAQLFPRATHFSEKEGNPPHFKAYGTAPDSEDPILMGFAFYTTELEPLERGYDGPIQVLVGIDLRGALTNLVIVDHNEPYGYFSIDLPRYAAQFQQKSIRDRFRVGDDIDAVSTATLTMRSATRAVRNGARRMARRFLRPEDVQ